MGGLLTAFIVVHLRAEEIRVGGEGKGDGSQTVQGGIAMGCIREGGVPVWEDQPTRDSTRCEGFDDWIHNRASERGVTPAIKFLRHGNV